MTKKILKTVLLLITVLSVCILTGCQKKNSNDSGEVSKDVYEQPIRYCMDGLKNRDLDQFLKAYPDFMNMAKTITKENIDDVYSQYEAIYGANIQLDYTLGDATKIDSSDIENLEAQLKETYPDAGDIKISKAYIIPVDLTITGDGIAEEGKEKEKTTNKDSQDFYVYEYNGNWYVY